MPAYMVITAKIHDRDRFINEYGVPTAELVHQLGGNYLMRAPGVTSLEGDWDGASMVISEWPDKPSALQFWQSEAYQALKKKREGLADCQVLLIEADSLQSLL